MKMKITCSILSATLLTGCPNGRIFERYDADSTSLSIDARQRTILSVTRADRQVICAEPSPDVAATLAASLGAQAGLAGIPQLGGGSVDAATQYRLAEQAAYIGARNSTIQLLRDGLYRACEAYINGALGDFGYSLVLVNYGKLMVSLLAAEGLTRPGLVPPVVFGSTLGAEEMVRNVVAGSPPQSSSRNSGTGGGTGTSTGGTGTSTGGTGTSTGGTGTSTGGTGTSTGGTGSGSASSSNIQITSKLGPGQPIVTIGTATNVTASTINDHIERIFQNVIYPLASPISDETGRTKATEILIGCMLTADRSGVRSTENVSSSLQQMCDKILLSVPTILQNTLMVGR
jgi:hypothetical protein